MTLLLLANEKGPHPKPERAFSSIAAKAA